MAQDKGNSTNGSDVTKLGDAAKSQEKEKAATKAADTKPEAREDIHPRDRELENYRSFNFKAGKRAGVLNDPNYVGNVPADRCTTWATDPRFDGGQHMQIVKSLGFRPVEPDEVSRDANRAGKLYLTHYDEWNSYVVRGGGVLMIGYKQYRDERRTAARVERRQELDEAVAKLNNQGIEQERTTKRGSLAEVQT